VVCAKVWSRQHAGQVEDDSLRLLM
jgi:hypothetical protein